VTSSIVDNFCKNPTLRIIYSALTESFCHNVGDIICKLSASGSDRHIAGIYVGVFMYADDLISYAVIYAYAE